MFGGQHYDDVCMALGGQHEKHTVDFQYELS